MKYALAALAALTFAGSAHAQTVNHRQDHQQSRIANGVASGRLTPGEAARVERQQGRINRTEQRMRSNNGGYLTAGQRARLQSRQNRASAHIAGAKHNGRGY